MMNRCLSFTGLILAVVILARGSLCFFAEEEKSELSHEEVFQLLCDSKSKPIIFVGAHLLCLAKITGSDIEKKKLTKKFEQIAGPELNKYASIKNNDELEKLLCSDAKKTAQMIDDLWSKIEKEGNVLVRQFSECWVEKFHEMHYQEECVKKDEGLRKMRTVGSRCKQNVKNENCTEIDKKIMNNPEKASEIACVSEETYMRFLKDKSCAVRGSDRSKFLNCIKSSIKK